MDTFSLHISSRRDARARVRHGKSLLCLTVSLACFSLNGCAVMREMMVGDRAKETQTTQATPPAAPCVQPDCSAPFQVTGNNMTTMPVIPGMAAQGQSQQGQSQALAMGQSSSSHSQQTSAPPPVIIAPPGYMLVPLQHGPNETQSRPLSEPDGGKADGSSGNAAAAVPPAGVPQTPATFGASEIANTRRGWPMGNLQAEHCETWSSSGVMQRNPSRVPSTDIKLQECEKQVTEMSVQLNTMKELHTMTRDEMRQLLQDQMQLKNENDVLRKKLEKSDELYIKSLDTLSQILEESTSPNESAEGVEPPASNPADTNAGTASEPVLLPAVESEL